MGIMSSDLERDVSMSHSSSKSPPTQLASLDIMDDIGGSSASSPVTKRQHQSQSPLLRTPFEVSISYLTSSTAARLTTRGQIIHKILLHSGSEHTSSVASAAQCCRELRAFIYENPDQALWRDLYLDKYDDPRCSGAYPVGRRAIEWKREIMDREAVLRMFREWGEDRYKDVPPHLDLICSTLLELYVDLPASLIEDDTEGTIATSAFARADSLNGPLLEMALRSELFAHIYYHLIMKEFTPQLRELPNINQSARPLRKRRKEVVDARWSRLHVLLSPDFQHEDPTHRSHRGYLREVVYSAKNYSSKNDWAPLDEEGKVDWNLVDAVGFVMMANAKDVLSMGEDAWRQAVLPLSYGVESVRGWGFNDLKRPKDLAPDQVWDWAGVAGSWWGSYAFLELDPPERAANDACPSLDDRSRPVAVLGGDRRSHAPRAHARQGRRGKLENLLPDPPQPHRDVAALQDKPSDIQPPPADLLPRLLEGSE
ncbi:hypothetical protein P7C73_g4430, partial [Tremellales sp. Uapishka_1]